jgi:hypothetical protein
MVKKTILFTVVYLALGMNVFTQEAKAAVGIGAEWNMNSRENFAAGAALGFDYNLASSFALGLAVTGSSNFSGIAVIEPAAIIRWYFLSSGDTGLFAQADLGCFMILEDGGLTPLFAGGFRGGFRLPFGKPLYVEPYGRIGYPFAFGIGALVGIRF